MCVTFTIILKTRDNEVQRFLVYVYNCVTVVATDYNNIQICIYWCVCMAKSALLQIASYGLLSYILQSINTTQLWSIIHGGSVKSPINHMFAKIKCEQNHMCVKYLLELATYYTWHTVNTFEQKMSSWTAAKMLLVNTFCFQYIFFFPGNQIKCEKNIEL